MLAKLWRWFVSLRRVTSSGKFIAEIDALRFFAIAGVVVHHIAEEVLGARQATASAADRTLVFALTRGAFGVQLFFAISGFILALPFIEHYCAGGPRVVLKKYFLRRLTRLEPPYIASLLMLFALKILTRHVAAAELFPHLLASATYTHMFVYHDVSSVNGVAWSLEVEIQFYVLVPLMAKVFAIARPALRRGVIVFAMIAVTVFQLMAFDPRAPWLPLWSSRTILGALQFFLVGFLLADVYVTTWRERSAGTLLGDVCWFGGWTALAALLLRGDRSIYLAPIAIFVIYAGFFRSRVRRWFTTPLFTVIGGMCYSIYLLHNTVILFALKALERLPAGILPLLAAVAAVAIPAVVLISAIFFRFVERPCMDKDWPSNLRRAFGGARMPAPLAPK